MANFGGNNGFLAQFDVTVRCRVEVADGSVGEIAMDRNRVLLIGGAVALVLFIAYMLGSGGGIVPR